MTGMRACRLPGAMAGVPALRMSVSPGGRAQRVHQLGRRAGHVERGGHAEPAQPPQRVPVVQVDVRVDEPGQQHAAAAVDDLGTARRRSRSGPPR